jgi:hypothetical protein
MLECTGDGGTRTSAYRGGFKSHDGGIAGEQEPSKDRDRRTGGGKDHDSRLGLLKKKERRVLASSEGENDGGLLLLLL